MSDNTAKKLVALIALAWLVISLCLNDGSGAA
jgi:hypothetical protein